MSKNTMKLEKECLEWKTKFQKCNISLIELATEKKDRDETRTIRANMSLRENKNSLILV